MAARVQGEVYRARDTKLGREVAIKVLPEAFARDEERMKRLEREAQVLASLNHPNIGSIYGLEDIDGVRALVLELVEGPTLAERIERGPIPLEEALPIAKQMAEALSEAHENRLIHRDLKPANVKLTPSGDVIVLDFGLAKALTGEGAGRGVSSELSQSETLSRQATAAGVILGTAAYMSPEQTKGKAVDRRTDIWAFGVVLYEMLTGKRLFHKEDVSETLAAVLRAEPDWGALPAETPSPIRLLLRRALRKNTRERLRDIADARLELDEALEAPEEVVDTPHKARTLPLLAGGLLLAALTAVVVRNLAPSASPPSRPVARFPLRLPAGDELTDRFAHMVAISPDGTRIVYSANDQLYVRALDEMEPSPLRGAESGAYSPFFSPDGRWVGFWIAGQLKKVSITGGAPVTLCAVPSLWGASWTPDDTIVFGSGLGGIQRVSAVGGTPEVLIPIDAGGRVAGPSILEDGKTVLFTLARRASGSGAQIVAQSLETGERRVLIEGGIDARYLPTGHLVYGFEGDLLAVPFDVDRLEVTGDPVPVVEDVRTTAFGGAAQFTFSETGALVYIPGAIREPERTLVWVDRGGNATPLAEMRRAYQRPRFSPDGKRLAVMVGSGVEADVWLLDTGRGVLTRMTFEGGVRLIWTPDGTRIVFASVRVAGNFDMFWKPANGSGAADQLTEGAYRIPDSISPDGKFLLFRQQNADTEADIGVTSFEEQSEPEILLGTPFNELHATISPDGRWFAYTSDESGRPEVYVRSFPDLGGKWQVSAEGGGEPVWSRDGKELFYRSGDKMMAARIATEPELAAERPVVLFEGAYELSGGGVTSNYDVAPDGRFVMIRSDQDSRSTEQQINVVLNWFEELTARVPTDQ